MRLAIIDIGTNTFNLLIAEVQPQGSYHVIFKTKIAVKLGEGGINKGIIQPAAFQRGIDALKEYHTKTESLHVQVIHAFATSAIRSASNGQDFVKSVFAETGIEIQVITGDREAELIYYGVRNAVKMQETYSLIMDVGGGSTEFIIANKHRIIWKQSFNLGAARLLDAFHESDPITPVEIERLRAHLMKELLPMFDAVSQYPVTELIGSSGSFDSLAEMIAHRFQHLHTLEGKTEYKFNLDHSEDIYQLIVHSTRAQRLKMKGLIEMRVDMIVVSAIFVRLILTELDLGHMRLSTYSLKEGVLWELIHKGAFA
jgi:exopolyphosphatase/guanosine-5'-triphosphate,3'-diphosphate pyrophosphatase